MGLDGRALKERKGNMKYPFYCSVGSHVRDSAAYIVWAIAKAYTAEAARPTADALTPTLLTAACYDREVTVPTTIRKQAFPLKCQLFCGQYDAMKGNVTLAFVLFCAQKSDATSAYHCKRLTCAACTQSERSKSFLGR